VKKTVNIRDSGFLDDEDGFSGRDSELPSSRAVNNKQNDPVSEEVPTPNDLINRKLKSKPKEIFFFRSFSYRFFFHRKIETNFYY
jgi:hypothetical protein